MARPKVLLVDDEDLLREAVAAVVSQYYEVVTAHDGHEALEVVGLERPDVIVLDVMMAHLSEGFDVARALRDNPETAAIPIIFLTGVDQVYDIRPEVGSDWLRCDRYLTKPPEPKLLLATIEELLTAAALR